MNIRDLKQQEAVEAHMNGSGKDIILAAPRFGKIKVSLEILKRKGAKKVLLIFPRNDILKGWEEEIQLRGSEIELFSTTTRSMEKYVEGDYDYIILDEIHEYSDNQLDVADGLVEKFPTIALSGTATKTTLKNIVKRTGLEPCFTYTIEEAVRDGVLCDYSISIHKVELDSKILLYKNKKGVNYTEKSWYAVNEYLMKSQGIKFFENKLLNIIQNSHSKLEKTKKLLKGAEGERIIVFCGTIESANKLGISTYHSENKDEDEFNRFCRGEGNTLATIKLAQAGVKIVPINRALFSYISGAPEEAAQKVCRVLAYEFNNPDKKAHIDIVISNTAYEKSRIKTSLNFFDPTKIKYYEE